MKLHSFVAGISPIIAASILAACGGGSGCGGNDGPKPETSTGTVNELGVLTENPIIISRDGGGSFFFSGRSVWLFGDTFFAAPDVDGEMLHSNSWSWTTDTGLGDGILPFSESLDVLGVPTAFFPLTSEERAFNLAHRGTDSCDVEPCGARWALWPGQAAVDPAGDRALVFYHKVYAEPGEFNFESVGSSVAVWTDPDTTPDRPIVQAGNEFPTLLFTESEPSFGDAALVVGGMLYAYGCDLDWLAKPCRLGRVAVDDVLDRSAWQFFAGKGNWVADVTAAEPIFDGADIMSVSYNAFVDRYVAVYSQPLGTDVVMRTAPRPEGPWTSASLLFSARAPVSETGWIYDAVTHPEFETENGRIIYVTYTRQTGPLQSELRLVSVELQAID